MEKLHPKAKVLFFIQYLFICIIVSFFILNFIGPLIFSLIINSLEQEYPVYIIGAVISYLVFLIVAIIFSVLWAVLTYNNWGYELRKDAVYVQRGVIWKHYSSIPYERVQNIDITRGVIARIFGFSSLMIQTAGYSGQKGPYSEGHIPAIDPKKAEEYREKILKMIKSKKQGL